MLTRGQVGLVLHAIALIGAMVVIVPALTEALGFSGYLLALVIYWLGFCLPVIALHVWHHRDAHLFSERLAWRDWFVPLLLLVQVAVIGIFAFVPNTAMLTTKAALLAAAVAVINGTLEELAWRGGFLTSFSDRRKLGFWLGWGLSTAWQVPLALSRGVQFDAGWMALVASAGLAGLVWNWIAWRTGSVFWTAIAHVLTNALTLWVLVDANTDFYA